MFDQTVNRFKNDNKLVNVDDEILHLIVGREKNLLSVYQRLLSYKTLSLSISKVFRNKNELLELLKAADKKGLNYRNLMQMIEKVD